MSESISRSNDLWMKLVELADRESVKTLFGVMSQGLGQQFFTTEVIEGLNCFFGDNSIERWNQLSRYFSRQSDVTESREIRRVMVDYMTICRNMTYVEAESLIRNMRQ